VAARAACCWGRLKRADALALEALAALVHRLEFDWENIFEIVKFELGRDTPATSPSGRVVNDRHQALPKAMQPF
jgi:hypothetical protein